jgi:hypothetical protein
VSPVRVSLYDRDRHLATVARSDNGTFVAASEPASGGESVVVAEEETPKGKGALPNVFAGCGGPGNERRALFHLGIRR